VIRLAAAAVLAYVAIAGVPQMPAAGPTRTIEEPSVKLQQVVADVGRALAPASEFDRLVWAATWEEAARLLEASRKDGHYVTFTDTLGVQAYQVVVLDIAWGRLAGAAGKYPGLQEAVEEAFSATIGPDVQPYTPEVEKRLTGLYRALAWAGLNRG
jgi:hypothetical protein